MYRKARRIHQPWNHWKLEASGPSWWPKHFLGGIWILYEWGSFKSYGGTNEVIDRLFAAIMATGEYQAHQRDSSTDLPY